MEKGNTCQLCGAIINDKGEITGTGKLSQRKSVTYEGKRHSSRMVEGRTELDLVQDEADEARTLLEEGHVEVQTAQNKVTGTSDGGNVPDQETVGGELGASRSMRTSQKKRLLGGIKKTRATWERWYEAIKEEEKLQSNRDITVQCIDFCEATTSNVHAVLQYAPSDLRGGTFLRRPRVLMATVDYQESPHRCTQILHAAIFQAFRGAYTPLRVLAVREGQERHDLLDIERHSPTLTREGFVTVLQSVCSHGHKLQFGDMQKAFNTGDPIWREETLFVRMPPDGVPGESREVRVQLLKTVNGLADGTREWRNCFLATARGLGFEMSVLEPCVLVLRGSQQRYHCIIGVAVDDIAGGGDEVWEQAIFKLKKRFTFGHWEG